MDKRFTIELPIDIFQVEMTVNYTPERSAPRVHDHDHPSFSDDGDDEDVVINQACLVEQYKGPSIMKKVCTNPLPWWVISTIMKAYREKILDLCREALSLSQAKEIADKERARDFRNDR